MKTRKEPGAPNEEGKEQDQPNEGGEGEGGEGSGAKKPEGKEGEEEKEDEEGDLSPEESKKLIKKLRAENAKRRKDGTADKAKLDGAIEALKKAGLMPADEEASPEKQIEGLTAHASKLEVKNAILEAAVEHGVGKEQIKYFGFLVQEAIDELKEGEELSEERLIEIAEEAGSKGAKAAKSTSVGKGGSKDKAGTPPPAGDKDEVTLAKFVEMNVLEKSQLHIKNPDLSSRLMKEARRKNLLIK